MVPKVLKITTIMQISLYCHQTVVTFTYLIISREPLINIFEFFHIFIFFLHSNGCYGQLNILDFCLQLFWCRQKSYGNPVYYWTYHDLLWQNQERKLRAFPLFPDKLVSKIREIPIFAPKMYLFAYVFAFSMSKMLVIHSWLPSVRARYMWHTLNIFILSERKKNIRAI